MDNKRIKVTELDFDQIKSNLKAYLQGQAEFSDYDFEGSSLSILIDTLAYNTHYNAMYAHLAMNESFLDSAAKRSSVVSHAKSLGYVPFSCKAARATVNIVVSSVTDNPQTLTLPTNSQFTASEIDGVSYTFFTREARTTSRLIDNTYLFEDVELIEGTVVRNRYEVADGAKYIIANAGADLSTLQVTVQDSSTSANYTKFTAAGDFTLVKATDNIYFVKEIDDELYEVYFGDGVTGKALSVGNVVTLNYIVCNKSAANKATGFTYNGNIPGTVIVTSGIALGGADNESIDSIKLNAPRSYSAQNRAVTALDYKTLLPEMYPNIDSINVWGGEENDPPQYGKVFISIKPKSGEYLTYSAKEYIKNQLLKSKNVVAIQPIIIDPEYLYISIQSSVYYNPLLTDKSADTIRALVVNTISNYDSNELHQFGGLFRYSKLSRYMDLSDASITSNITNIRMTKKLEPQINTKVKYTINFGNPIYNEGVAEEAVRSSGFRVVGVDQLVYMDDDGAGRLRMFYTSDQSTKVFVMSNLILGTVDYTTGIITLNSNFIITSALNDVISFHCVPDSHDVLSLRNQLVVINLEEVKVDVIVDKVASGQFTGGSNYIFSSSHNYSA